MAATFPSQNYMFSLIIGLICLSLLFWSYTIFSIFSFLDLQFLRQGDDHVYNANHVNPKRLSDL